ncbi:ATP-dependent Clp protease proteolytic subunit [Rhodoligotrophos defluvii]|uniref:ATP-dependent Clp protease proteolytic subunit n=1 Tax=Rhodoligotrophos defluvii TaxID=2561934 RepID=UPI0010C97FB3|nr:ATP-dependent Clp protease proteolytic subunit [Rhodoligotrophos defluvii]
MSSADPSSRRSTLWRRAPGEARDETILRSVFFTLVALATGVLGYDLAERMKSQPPPAVQTLSPAAYPDVQPFLPSIRPEIVQPGDRRTPAAELQKPMTIELVADGRLEAIGTITPGTAERFQAEIEKRGDYVKAVVLNSPGGSVEDALAMAELIRARKLATLVEAKGLCASSCPLVLAGGVERIVESGASVGVHQVYAIAPASASPFALPAEGGFARAQQVSARCQRHLVDMGVDPQVWIHAMETPPQQIFYFTPEELIRLNLATGSTMAPAQATAAPAKQPPRNL